jgi:pectinesterase
MDCATLHVNATGFGLENITVENSFNYIQDSTKYGDPQGFALTIAEDGAVINNVHLYGNQDTLFFKSGRTYLVNSIIEGNVDFIFGENSGLAFFEQCLINAVYRGNTTNTGYVTAMKGDATNYPTYGYVFNECTFDDDGNVLDGAMSLGRPWGAGASVTYINCSFTAAYSTLAYDGKAKSRWFDMSGINLYAVDKPVVNLVLAVKGE